MTSAVEAAVEAADEVSQSIRADFFCSCSLKRLCGTRGASPEPLCRAECWAEFGFLPHSSPRRMAGEKKSDSYNHKRTIWVSHEYYLNPEFHKIPARAF